MKTTIEAAPIVRNADGSYYHPALASLPDTDESAEAFTAWLAECGVQAASIWMEGDAPELADRYAGVGADGDPSALADWQPTVPPGDGWFLLAIFDTEDGPVAHYVRPIPAAQ